MLTLTSLGGAGTVTGSKHLLASGDKRILIDCGLFQGLKNLRELNWEPLPIAPSDIDAVILTHAHLDHSGYLPKLVRDGFRGKIYATEATRDVAELILKDSGHLQEKDAEYANRKGFSKHNPALALYGIRDAERSLEFFSTVPFDTPIELPFGATLIFRHAGHILGAATAEVEWGGRRIAFSGDLGRYGDPVLPDPAPVPVADYVLIESTYGNRIHDPADPTEALGAVVERTIARGGTVVVPAFAVGRVQSLLYHLWRLKTAGRLSRVPIYLDSPMAINATDLLHAHRHDHRLTPEHLHPRSRGIEGCYGKRLSEGCDFRERHGDGRSCPPSPEGLCAPRPQYDPVFRLPGGGNARPRHAARCRGNQDPRAVGPCACDSRGIVDAVGPCRRQ